MTYDDKVRDLASAIASHVPFENIEQATEHKLWYRHGTNSDIGKAMDRMASHLYTYAQKLGIKSALDKIEHGPETEQSVKLSALREAIGLCAERFIESAKLEELADIGSADLRPISRT